MKKKVLIVTYGSTGDIYPYLALGKVLVSDFEVTICTNRKFKEIVASQGLNHCPLNDDITELISSLAGQKAMESLNSFWGFIKTTFKLMSKINRIQKDILWDSWNSVKQVKPDLLIYNPKTYFVCHFADAVSAKLLCVPLFPQAVATEEFPAIGFPSAFGKHLNKLTYKIVGWSSKFIVGKQIAYWRKSVNLPPKHTAMNITQDTSGRDVPVFNAYSKYLVPHPYDYPDNVETVGFFGATAASPWVPPNSLVNFLEKYPNTIYIGFGSMSSSNAKHVSSIIIDVLSKTNISAVIAKGWGGLVTNEVSERVYVIEEAPHSWLFERVTAVIHHGGAGTTAAGVLAGVPTLICPIFGDQPLWGECIAKHKIGVKPIPQKKLTIKNFESALVELTTNPELKVNAKRFASLLKSENGVIATSNKIRSLLTSEG